MLLDSMLPSLPCFYHFLQSILLVLLFAFAIAQRSMGGMVHRYTLIEYKSIVLLVERQKILNVVLCLQSQINEVTVFESRKRFASNINPKILRMKTLALPKLSTPGKLDLARAALANNLPALSKLIAAIPGSPDKVNTTKYFATRFLNWFENQDRPNVFSIFGESGNKKLPFYAFSSLPGFDCPGAGACLFGEGNKRDSENFATGWCYSFKGWRYPAAFFRQLQNSVLMRSAAGRLTIQHAFNEIPENKVLRLYVDGDFSGRHNIVYWMELMRSRPDVQVYGYSKSWHAFIALDESGFQWPANYKLNLSSGSKYNSAAWLEKMGKLSCVRGSFIAVPVARKHITSKAYQDKNNAGSKEYRKDVLAALKEAGHEKRFACPGNCGNCLPNGQHACGSDKLDGVTIGIGVHN